MNSGFDGIWLFGFPRIRLLSRCSRLLSASVFSSLDLCEELLSALGTDEEAEFPWQQPYLHRHRLILLIVDVVEARGALRGPWQS